MDSTKENSRMGVILGYNGLVAPEKEETVKMNFRIKRSEYELFKRLCEISGTKMTDVLTEHIRSLIY